MVFYSSCRTPALDTAVVQQFIYGADVVPRLLGSDLPLMRAALAAVNISWLSEEVLETFPRYTYPRNLQLIYISPVDGSARIVPRALQRRVLDVYQAASPNAVLHHSMYKAGLAPAGREEL